MSRIVMLTTLLLPVAVSAFEGTLDTVATQHAPGKPDAARFARIFVSPLGARIQVPAAVRQPDVSNAVLLLKGMPDTVLHVIPSSKAFEVVGGPDELIKGDIRVRSVVRLKPERVSDHLCTHALVHLSTGDSVEVWADAALSLEHWTERAIETPAVRSARRLLRKAGVRGVLMRMIHRTGDSEMRWEVTKVTPAKLEPSLFSVAGYHELVRSDREAE
jgi:Domain of unknown function (DUF4412)